MLSFLSPSHELLLDNRRFECDACVYRFMAYLWVREPGEVCTSCLCNKCRCHYLKFRPVCSVYNERKRSVKQRNQQVP